METARFSAPRRSATAPVGLAQQPAGQGGVETLYNHPNAKIVAFTATARAVPRSPSPRDSDEDLGTLSWSSQLERTIAVGTPPRLSVRTHSLDGDGRQVHANRDHQEPSASTAPPAPSPSSTAAPPSSPSSRAASAGA